MAEMIINEKKEGGNVSSFLPLVVLYIDGSEKMSLFIYIL